MIIALFAKAPVPGAVKTRLIPLLGPWGAARLAEAFLLDALALLRPLAWARTVIATTGPFDDALARAIGDVERWDQGGGDLGARMERVLRRALEGGSSAAIALGADSPGLTGEHLEEARRVLARGQAVLGPAEDGGYFLIGLDTCPEGLLAGLPWSSRETGAATRARLESRGLSVGTIRGCFDVDEPADLLRLEASLRAGRVVAPETRAVLEELGRL
jgi:uncharacterized protein